MGANNSAPTSQTLLLASTFSECQKLYDFLEDFTRSNDIPDETFQDLKLIAEEIVANIINHGYNKAPDQKIEIIISANSTNIEVSFIDEAAACDPLELAKNSGNVKDQCEGGMGAQIIKSLTSTQSYERVGEHNVLTITKHYNDQNK